MHSLANAPLIWMFHDRYLNAEVNKIYKGHSELSITVVFNLVDGAETQGRFPVAWGTTYLHRRVKRKSSFVVFV